MRRRFLFISMHEIDDYGSRKMPDCHKCRYLWCHAPMKNTHHDDSHIAARTHVCRPLLPAFHFIYIAAASFGRHEFREINIISNTQDKSTRATPIYFMLELIYHAGYERQNFATQQAVPQWLASTAYDFSTARRKIRLLKFFLKSRQAGRDNTGQYAESSVLPMTRHIYIDIAPSHI